eukprot:7197025-Pyramimonas_sp.AAC.1
MEQEAEPVLGNTAGEEQAASLKQHQTWPKVELKREQASLTKLDVPELMDRPCGGRHRVSALCGNITEWGSKIH